MKRLLLLLSFLLIATNCWATTITFGAVAGNWSDGTKWVGGAKPANGDDVVFAATSADCVVNENTANLKSLDMATSLYLGTLSGSSAITVTGAASSTVSVKFGGTITWTGTLNLNPAAGTTKINLTSGGKTITYLTANLSGQWGEVELQDSLTTTGDLNRGNGTFDTNGQDVILIGTAQTLTNMAFTNLTRTGTATKTDTLVFASNTTISGTFTANGNSGTNRLLVYSNTLGTARTITNTNAITGSNVDFRDITVSTASNLSAATGGSGDCGGNTGITFTTADDWYFYQTTNGETINFSNNNYWYSATNGGGTKLADEVAGTPTANRNAKAILPQDNCNFDASSINGTGTVTVDQDMPRMCKTLDFTGVDAMAFHMDNLGQTIYGSLIFSANVTLTVSTSYGLTFESMDRSGTYTYTPVSASKELRITVASVGGRVNLGGNLDAGSRLITLSHGTFDANDYNITCGTFNSDVTTARTLLMGNGTWTVSSTTAANTWDTGNTSGMTSTNVGEGSTLVWGGATNNALVLEGGGLTFNNLTIPATGTNHTLTGSNTFSTFTINAPKTVKLTSGTTTVVSSLVATGTAGNEIYLQAVTANVIATISDASGTNVNDYLIVNDIVATQTNTFYYGANGSADAESTNWLQAPTATTGFMTCNKGIW